MILCITCFTSSEKNDIRTKKLRKFGPKLKPELIKIASLEIVGKPNYVDSTFFGLFEKCPYYFKVQLCSFFSFRDLKL